MLTLFPQYRVALGVGWLLTAAVAGFMIQAGSAWYWPVLVVMVCGFFSLAIAEMAAAGQHQKILMILYRDGKPKDFIRAYEPLLSQRCTVPSRLLTLRAYLGNGYAALGDFEKALELLNGAPEVTGREADNAKALLAGNRCAIYLKMGEAGKAEEQLALLKSLRFGTTAKPELFTEIPQLECRLAVLKGDPVDASVPEKALETAVSPIRRADLMLSLANACLARKNTEKARRLLEKLAEDHEELWTTQEAKRILSELPGKKQLTERKKNHSDS